VAEVDHSLVVVGPCMVDLAQDGIAEVFGDSQDSLAEVPSFLGHKEDILASYVADVQPGILADDAFVLEAFEAEALVSVSFPSRPTHHQR
jgi:hypothetical protein